MSDASYLDYNGLLYFWGKLKAYFATISHTHGSITNAGKIGSTANLPVITGTGGLVTTSSFGTAANTFCQGNDSRLSDSRTPTSHTHGNVTNDGKLATASAVVVTDANSNILASTTINTTELSYLDGVTSNIQTQLDGKLTSHQSLSNYYTKTEIDTKLTSAMHYKGSVATIAALDDISSPAVGDMYNVTATGNNYAYDGSSWDIMGATVTITSITNSEIDTVVAS